MRHFIVLSVALVAASCAPSEPGRIEQTDEGATVVVSSAVTWPSLKSFPATLVPVERADLATRMSGTVNEVSVDVGTSVTAGQLLLELDASDIEARVAAAEANAELARRSHSRIENLARDGAASQQELDEVTARLQAAEAGLRDARAQAAYAVLRAPFDGVVTSRMVDPGDLAAPGSPLLSLLGRGALKVEADLPGELAGSIQPGDNLSVHFPSMKLDAPVRVTQVVPALTPGSRRFRVEARFASELPEERGLVPGAYVRLVLEEGETSTRWIPGDAVVRRGQLTGVFTVEDSRLRLRWIRLGEERDDAVELLSGSVVGHPIVRRPGADLYDGRSVTRAQNEEWPSMAAVAVEVVR